MLFDSKKDYYAILGITELFLNADLFKQKFRKLALVHHPDKGGDVEKFKEINEAYSVLSDPSLKRQYDASRAPAPQPKYQGGIRFYGYGSFATTSTNSQWDAVRKFTSGNF